MGCESTTTESHLATPTELSGHEFNLHSERTCTITPISSFVRVHILFPLLTSQGSHTFLESKIEEI